MMRASLIVTTLSLAFAIGCAPSPGRPELTIYAAASLRDVMVELGDTFSADRDVDLVYNFASSNALANQLIAAPKADLFFSASEKWMNAVEETGRLAPDSRRALLSNTLTVVLNKDAEVPDDVVGTFCAPTFKNLSIGNPDAVPAGIYARQWLESVSCDGGTAWACVKERVAPAPDVRAALALVEADPTIWGIVYKTDALTSSAVQIAYEVPRDEGPQIRYYVGQLAEAESPELATAFANFLSSDSARAILTKYGFTPLDE